MIAVTRENLTSGVANRGQRGEVREPHLRRAAGSVQTWTQQSGHVGESYLEVVRMRCQRLFALGDHRFSKLWNAIALPTSDTK